MQKGFFLLYLLFAWMSLWSGKKKIDQQSILAVFSKHLHVLVILQNAVGIHTALCVCVYSPCGWLKPNCFIFVAWWIGSSLNFWLCHVRWCFPTVFVFLILLQYCQQSSIFLRKNKVLRPLLPCVHSKFVIFFFMCRTILIMLLHFTERKTCLHRYLLIPSEYI